MQGDVTEGALTVDEMKPRSHELNSLVSISMQCAANI